MLLGGMKTTTFSFHAGGSNTRGRLLAGPGEADSEQDEDRGPGTFAPGPTVLSSREIPDTRVTELGPGHPSAVQDTAWGGRGRHVPRGQ